MCIKMSDVRLSNASPTLERVDARQPDTVRPPVRRNLFGSPDRQGLRRYFEAAMQEGVQDFRDNYNFDPVTDTPLTPRNYEWQEDSDAPEFFRRSPHRSQRPQRGEDSPGDDNRQDAEGSSQRESGRPTDRVGSRKRRPEASGPCSGERHTKRSHTDEDDDEDQPGGAACQAVLASEERQSGAENSAEVQ